MRDRLLDTMTDEEFAAMIREGDGERTDVRSFMVQKECESLILVLRPTKSTIDSLQRCPCYRVDLKTAEKLARELYRNIPTPEEIAIENDLNREVAPD